MVLDCTIATNAGTCRHMLAHPFSQPAAVRVMFIGDCAMIHCLGEGKHLFCFWEEREDNPKRYLADTANSCLWGGWFESDKSLKARNGNYVGFLEARVITPFIKFVLSEEIFTLSLAVYFFVFFLYFFVLFLCVIFGWIWFHMCAKSWCLLLDWAHFSELCLWFLVGFGWW